MKRDFLYYFKRDLNKLKKEMEQYPNEASLWLTPDGINNSAGNLCCHLVGNLNHYIGCVLGETGYVRNRTEEFECKDVLRSVLYERIEATIEMLEKVLPDLDLSQPYPKGYFSVDMGDNHSLLLQLLGHLTYHIGQINYHRRLLGTSV